MPTMDYFEIPADNEEEAIKFYSEIFGWKFEKTHGDQPYWMIRTGEEKEGENASGGLQKRMLPEQQITMLIGVKSVDETIEKVKANGGAIITPKTNAMDMVNFAIVTDNQKNSFGIWESIKKE